MARCEQGYLCAICGADVSEITDSDLYLRYLLGWVDPETLHTVPDKHIRCNPVLAQFIVGDDFEPIHVDGEFDKRLLDDDYRIAREQLVTAAWTNLHSLPKSGLAIIDYRRNLGRNTVN